MCLKPLLKNIFIPYTHTNCVPATNCVCVGYTIFTLSVCPSISFSSVRDVLLVLGWACSLKSHAYGLFFILPSTTKEVKEKFEELNAVNYLSFIWAQLFKI